MLMTSSAAKSMTHVLRNVRARARVALNKRSHRWKISRFCLVFNPSDCRIVREGAKHSYLVNEGKVDGKQLLSPSLIDQMVQHHVPVPGESDRTLRSFMALRR